MSGERDRWRSIAVKCRQDFKGYAERFLRIKSKSGKIIPLRFNTPQMRILDAINKQIALKRPVRIVILKSRQLGSSTFCQAWLAHKAFLFEGQNCLTIAQSLDMAGELFSKTEMMYRLLPDELRPAKDSKSRGKRLAMGDPLNSLLFVESAENRDAGRSATFQHAQATEIPFWPDAKTTMDGLLQSIPNEAGTSVIVESTANGMGDYFHNLYDNATKGTNGFIPVFLPWFEMEEYRRIPIKSDFPLDKRIAALQREHYFDNDRAVWYQDRLRELQNDWDKLSQEYPTTPEVAFLVSGRPFFHVNTIKHYEKMCTIPKRKGTYKPGELGRGYWKDSQDGEIWVWEEPKPGEKYVIGVDIATGRAADNSAFHVFKGTQQVASYVGRHEPDELARLVAWCGLAYNQALIVPERNSVGIAVIIPLVKEIKYPNVYQHERLDTTTHIQSIEFGWPTTAVTRPLMLERLAALSRTGDLKLYCERTISEMKTFTFQDELGKKAEANRGSRDDMIMSLAISLAALDHVGSGEVTMIRRRGKYNY